MKYSKYKHIFAFLAVFVMHYAYATKCFAANAQFHKSSWAVNPLKGDHYNNDVLSNGNNAIQIVSARTAKTGHFLKILFVAFISFAGCFKYLKNKLKAINSEYAQFLKRLLFPNHVFW